MFKFIRSFLVSAALLFSVALPTWSASIPDATENSLVDWFLRGQAYTPAATNYVALYTVAPTDSTAGTEVTGGSYARVAILSALSAWAGTQGAGTSAASSGTGGTTSNNAAITFPAPTASWGTVVAFCLTNAITAGTRLFCANLTASKTINNGDPAPYFAPNALTFQIDN